MNEQELRQALRATMATATVPPPMSETPVLDAARRDLRRRRARWAGAGSAVAVAVIAASAGILLTNSGDGPGAVRPGGFATAQPTPTAGTAPGGGAQDTETSWPNGQTDRTARSGPESERGETLLARLTELTPAGFGAPDDLDYQEPGYTGSLRSSQAAYSDTVGGVEVWEYLGHQPITKGKGVGQTFVQLTTPGGGAVGEGCALKPTLWGLTGTCAEVVVGGKRVGVYTASRDRGDFESWAGFRHDDGSVVFVAQSRAYPGSGRPALTELPWTARRLAELAASPVFRLD